MIVNLIANTKTKTGLTSQAELDTGSSYPTGIQVSDEDLAQGEMANLFLREALREQVVVGTWLNGPHRLPAPRLATFR